VVGGQDGGVGAPLTRPPTMPEEGLPAQGYPAPPGWVPGAPPPPTTYHFAKPADAGGAGPSKSHLAAAATHVHPAVSSEVTASFITLLDALALKQNTVADLKPLLHELCSALEQARQQRPDFVSTARPAAPPFQ